MTIARRRKRDPWSEFRRYTKKFEDASSCHTALDDGYVEFTRACEFHPGGYDGSLCVEDEDSSDVHLAVICSSSDPAYSVAMVNMISQCGPTHHRGASLVSPQNTHKGRTRQSAGPWSPQDERSSRKELISSVHILIGAPPSHGGPPATAPTGPRDASTSTQSEGLPSTPPDRAAA